MSSSICSPCGVAESEANEQSRMAELQEYESSPFGQFMSMPEDERWRTIFERLQELGVA